MDSFFKKAQEFASASLKKSQELATTAAAQSRELASETAKQTRLAAQTSYKAAAEASRKAEVKLKQLAQDLNAKPQGVSKEQELQEAGITEELIDFIRGIDIKTFRKFPLEDALAAKEGKEGASLPRSDSGMSDSADSPGEKTPQAQRVDGSELTPFQEHHATLVLKTVQEVADFRYVLCPRRMKESRFWKIYFTLVHSHIAPYEARWEEAQAAKRAPAASAETTQKDPAKPNAVTATAASIAETMKPLQDSFLVGMQEVRAGLTQAGRTIANKVSTTTTTSKPASQKPKPANSGIRNLAAIKEAVDAAAVPDKKQSVQKSDININSDAKAGTSAAKESSVREATGAVQTVQEKAAQPDAKENAKENAKEEGSPKGEDHDLDAYLMGALDGDADDDDDDEEGFNEEDFEKLVNSSGFSKDEHKAEKVGTS